MYIDVHCTSSSSLSACTSICIPEIYPKIAQIFHLTSGTSTCPMIKRLYTLRPTVLQPTQALTWQSHDRLGISCINMYQYVSMVHVVTGLHTMPTGVTPHRHPQLLQTQTPKHLPLTASVVCTALQDLPSSRTSSKSSFQCLTQRPCPRLVLDVGDMGWHGMTRVGHR